MNFAKVQATGDLLNALASSSDSDDGGSSPPPRKKQRLTADTMHQANGRPDIQHNGDLAASTRNSVENGACASNGEMDGRDEHLKLSISKSDQDVIRLIGQHLRGLGLKYEVTLLVDFLRFFPAVYTGHC